MAMDPERLKTDIITGLLGTAESSGVLKTNLNQALKEMLGSAAPEEPLGEGGPLQAIAESLAQVIAQQVVRHMAEHARVQLPNVPVVRSDGGFHTEAVDLRIE